MAKPKKVHREAPINVLLLVDKFDYHGSQINGPARFYSWVTERLNRDKVNPVVCALRGRGGSDRLFAERGIDVVYLGFRRLNPLVLPRIVRLILEKEIDLVHLTGYASTTAGRVAAALCGVPAIVHEHWVDPSMTGLHSLFERCMSVVPVRAIAISEYAREFLVEKKGIPREAIVLIRNGIPLEDFREASVESAVAMRKKLGLPSDVRVVGIVGMLHANKGHRYYLEAASRVVAQRSDVLFAVIGDGELRASLEYYAAELGLGRRVRFLGEQREMPAILRMLDVWVMASVSETAPLSLLEAMAAGKAIVTSDCGGPSEIIRDGVNGLVVPSRDAEALAEAVGRLLDAPDLRSTLGRAAMGASAEFDIDRTSRQLEALYVETAAGG